MRYLIAPAIVGLLTMGTMSTAAQAKVGDKAWAQCVWETSSASAEAWLKEETPTWRDNLDTKGEVLGFRLIALCSAEAADPENPNKVPKWKAMKRRLEREKPDSRAAANAGEVSAELCESYSVGDGIRALYKIDIIRVVGSRRTTAFEQYFTTSGGKGLVTTDKRGRPVQFTIGGGASFDGRVRLPQVPMKTATAEGYATEKVCRTIEEDGTLSNA